MSINGSPVGSYSHLGKTFTLVDESGTEFTGVVVDNETVFTATDKQVADGYVYAGDHGVSTGTREFLTYRTTQGVQMVPAGSNFSISLPEYDNYNYTQLQCIIAPFNTSMSDSYAADKIVLSDGVYATGSIDRIADVTKNSETKCIDLNIVNTSANIYLIYFFTYKQEEI